MIWIYDLSRQDLQMNAIFIDLHNAIFDFLIKHTHHKNNRKLPHTTPLPYSENYTTLLPEYHVTRYCIPIKTKRQAVHCRTAYGNNRRKTHRRQGATKHKERKKVSNGAHLNPKVKNPNAWRISPSIKLIIIYSHPQHCMNRNNSVGKNNHSIKEELQNVQYTRRTANKNVGR
jgi:hypothetical protein